MISGPRCENCGSRNKLMICSRCRRVYYCSKEHQVADWKRHKKQCTATEAKSTDQKITTEDPLCDLSCLCDERLFPNNSEESAMRQKNRVKKKFVKNCDIVQKHSGNENKNRLLESPQFRNAERAEARMPLADYTDRTVDSAGNISYDHLTEVCLASLGKSKRDELSIVEEVCQNVIQDMDSYGVCVVDNFLGKERGMEVLREVKEMYSRGMFEDGQLVSSRGHKDLKTIRSDRIAWIDGKDPACSNIDMLITEVDTIVMKANRMENNGKMGHFVINGRTKAMVACYPGDGAHYVKHVDNPNKDGRCITAIYYLNPDWDTEKDGGLLRIFPEDWEHQVADIAPVFDRVLFFWSDRRNPHEVQPSYKTRYAITLWYFDAAERQEACRRFMSMNKRL